MNDTTLPAPETWATLSADELKSVADHLTAKHGDRVMALAHKYHALADTIATAKADPNVAPAEVADLLIERTKLRHELRRVDPEALTKVGYLRRAMVAAKARGNGWQPLRYDRPALCVPWSVVAFARR